LPYFTALVAFVKRNRQRTVTMFVEMRVQSPLVRWLAVISTPFVRLDKGIHVFASNAIQGNTLSPRQSETSDLICF
jgi:hypothetical protein